MLAKEERATRIGKAPYNKVYPVVLSKIQFDKKPTAYQRLHDELDSTESTYMSLYDLLEAVTNGQTFKNGIHAKPSEQYHDYMLTKEEELFLQNKKNELPPADYIKAVRLMKQQKIKNELKESGSKDKPEFIETDLAILDVDDVLGQADPIDMMKQTGAVALYYTFSHDTLSPVNTRMKRYRLLFDLSETVNGKKALEAVQAEIKSDILKQYEHLNEQKFKNKSHGIDNITKMFYGSNRDYEINENFKTYDVSNILKQFEKEQEFNQLVNKIERLNAPNARTTDSEIIDIANFLGDMNDELSHDEWTALSIGLWNTAQIENIDDKVIVEALQILDGHRNNEKYYLRFKQPLNNRENQSSIGTLIRLATDRGYKRKYSQQPSEQAESAPQIATRKHRINEYINKNDIYKLLANSAERILVKSDTNTGKTRASIEASKEYLKDNKKAFIYIALPTRALSQQVVEDYNLNQPIMENRNVQKAVKEAIYNDSRLLVGTYDKARIVYQLLQDYNVLVIADEVHKETFDYNYRHEAIQNLFDLDVPKFIGLTGTPSEIDLSNYDNLEVFELSQPKILADELQFINYSNANGYENLTAQIIESEVKKNGQKVLAFINHKDVIKKLARALRKQGLNVATITADNRRSKTYKHILESQSFDDDVDVVLTTIVLADGINIKNTKDYVCLIAPSHYKNVHFYNIDMIQQATNRFRNQYSKIIVPLYINKHLRQDNVHDDYKYRLTKKPYPLETEYNKLLASAELAKITLQTEFKENFHEFIPSTAEKLSGLFRPKEADGFNFKRAYKNKQLAQQGLNHDERLLNELERLESKIWDIDKRTIRQQASEDKETYYSLRPYAFRTAIKRALNVLSIADIEAHDYLLQMESGKELSEILKELDQLELKSEQEKRDNIQLILHELVYAKIQKAYFESGHVNESLNEWKKLKEKMSSMHYRALTKLISFMSYDEVMKELKYIKKSAQIYELVRSFKALNELQQYQATESNTITEDVFYQLKANIIGRTYLTAKERDEHIKELAKDFKIKGRYTIANRQEIFKAAFNKYFALEQSKSVRVDGKVRKASDYNVISFEKLASDREASTEYIKRLYDNFNY